MFNIHIVDLYFILGQIKLETTGMINLTKLMLYYGEILGEPILSSKLVFYTIAEKLQSINTSTIEFVYLQNLTLSQELNINEFYINLIEKLNIDNKMSVLAFKALDINKIGKIRVEDFVIVIDSYRDNKRQMQTIEQNENDVNDDVDELKHKRFNLSDIQIFWINKYCIFLKRIDITQKMAFDTTKTDPALNEINLDALKRKLKILSKDLLSALELNNISNAFDVNGNRFIDYEDYKDVIESSRQNQKFRRLFNNNYDTSSLLNDYTSKGTDISKLPFRSNKTSHVDNYNINDIVSKEHEHDNDINGVAFKEDDAYKTGTNMAIEYVEQKAKDKLIDTPNDKEIFEIIKQLEVFESAEWSLIELFEDFDINDNNAYAPCVEMYRELQKKYSPTINKYKLFHIINALDKDKDGYFTYLDLMYFLFVYFTHRSTKIAWKEITREIIYGMEESVEDFFGQNLKTVNNTGIVSFVEFTRLITNTFHILPPIAKQMFHDLQNLIVNHRVTRGDIIDAVNRQVEANKLKNKQREITAYDKVGDLTMRNYLMSNQDNELNNKFNSITYLDKKYYEQEMLKFVNNLQKAFIPPNDETPKDTFITNITEFLHLPKQMKLAQFRELFIKPLSMKYALGLSTFQVVNSFNNEHSTFQQNSSSLITTIDTETLMEVITSYIDEERIAKFEPALLIYFIENAHYTPIKYCFESIEYNHRGISVLDIIKAFQSFYPKLPKGIVKGIARKIDLYEQGYVNYKNLCDFIFKYSNSDINRISCDLMIKHLASLIDRKNENTKTYLNKCIFGDKRTRQMKYVFVEEHERFFNGILKFNPEQTEHLFLNLINIGNKQGYTFDYLVRIVDLICTENKQGDNNDLNGDIIYYDE